MTAKQTQQFNRMLNALRAIASGYQTPYQLRRKTKGEYWLDFEDAIEMAYDNIQSEAKNAVKGVRKLKLKGGA